MKKALMISTAALLVLALPVLARDWGDDFTPVAPSMKQPGHYEWGWNGADRLVMAVPGTLHYTPGGKPGIVVTGPEELLAHVEVGDGRIQMNHDENWNYAGHERLQVTVTGVTVHDISVAGSGEAHLDGLALDHVNLAVSGSGSLTAAGRGDMLRLSLSGSGHADLSQLAARDTDLNISGSGVVTEGGHGEHLRLNMSGSGRVELAAMQTRDAVIHMSGSGKVTIGGGIEHLDLNASGAPHVDLGKLSAREATLRMTGSGTVTGTGNSDRVLLSLSGSGRMEMSQLETRDADIRISGNGMVDISPRDSANVTISGSGSVRMKARPAHFTESIRGPGKIHIDGE